MSDQTTNLLRLMSWLSPVFPTGGFAYSSGLEQAVADGAVSDQPSLKNWLAATIAHGSLWNDAVLITESHRACTDPQRIEELSQLCRALCVAAERHQEIIDQGASFLDAAKAWFQDTSLPSRQTPLPVAVGVVAGLSDIDRGQTIAAYLNTYATNQLQCAIRLSVTGQTGAARTLAALEPLIAETAQHAAQATTDDLGSGALGVDSASMTHQTLEPRLFLS